MHRRDIAHVDRRPVHDLQGDVLQVRHGFDVASPAHVVLGGGDLEDLSPHLVVRAPDLCDHLGQRNAVGREFIRIQVDLVLLHKAADRGHLGDSRHGFEGITQVPVLE